MNACMVYRKRERDGVSEGKVSTGRKIERNRKREREREREREI